MLALSTLGAIVVLVGVALPLYMGIAEKHSVLAAADAGALAAADTIGGVVDGDPCSLAARVVDANGAQLSSCEVDGAVVTVRVASTILGLIVSGSATAGPNHGGAD